MKNTWKAAICGLTVMSLAVSASALTLTLNNAGGPPINSVTITDNGPGDLNPGVGVITFLGAVGNWNINVTTGISGPSSMDLNSIDATAIFPNAGALVIDLSDTKTVYTGFKNSVGGTLGGGSANFSTYFNGGLVTSQNFVPTAFSGTAFGAASGVGLVEIIATLNPSATGPTTDSFNDSLCVPDGGLTVSLLGFAMVSVGYLRRRVAA